MGCYDEMEARGTIDGPTALGRARNDRLGLVQAHTNSVLRATVAGHTRVPASTPMTVMLCPAGLVTLT